MPVGQSIHRFGIPPCCQQPATALFALHPSLLRTFLNPRATALKGFLNTVCLDHIGISGSWQTQPYLSKYTSAMITKYTREEIAIAATNAVSVAHTLRNLGLKGVGGGSYCHIKNLLLFYGIDTSHFLGRRANSGSRYRGGSKPRRISEVLQHNKSLRQRTAAHILRRCLRQSGVKYECLKCGIGPHWDGTPLTLSVDHINGDWRDNRRENLRFLCPNCHSQTDTFCSKNGAGGGI